MNLPSTLLLLSALVFVASAQFTNVVQTTSGPVRGNLKPTHEEFLGIPYAKSPIGKLRWAPPEKPEPSSSVLQVTSFKPGCPQSCNLPSGTCPVVQSEDCLTLNVWAPSKKSSELLPVFLFFPGGRFMQGTAGSPLYSGEFMANKTDIILVTSNYRLGSLGWLYWNSTFGNFGFKDQLLALHWVQDNIKAFGGDPTRVTLGGQSAGAASTSAHLISPYSKGLFHQAIMESNPWTLGFSKPETSASLNSRFSSDLGCPVGDFDCLRSASVESILAAQKASIKHISLSDFFSFFYPFPPTVDGDFIPGPLMEQIENGGGETVPLLMGTVANESVIFIYEGFTSSMPKAEYDVLLLAFFGLDSIGVSNHYPAGDADDLRPNLSRIVTDWVFKCASRKTMRSLQSTSSYLYWFNHPLSYGKQAWGPNFPFCWYNVTCHATELAFVFDSAATNFTLTAPEVKLTNTIGYAWTNFVKNGNPNKGLPLPMEWPEYTAAADQAVEFSTPAIMSPADHLAKERCDYWDKVGYYIPAIF